ncbi:MAG: NYN domain-containing protein [Acidimicrobiia bacterium]
MTSSTQREASRIGETLPVAESLLVPLLDVAASVLARLDPGDAPGVLRPLAGFDRRRLTTSGPARQQLRRAFDVDDGFRDDVVEKFREQPEVAAALEAWSVDAAPERVADAAERSDLPLLASALYAARPKGWTFGLGMVCAAAERDRTEHEREDDTKAWEVRLASVEEARRRAEQARDEAQAATARVETELRDERATRREREESAASEVNDAQQRRNDAELVAEQATGRAATAEARLEREADRAREAELQLRLARRELNARAQPDRVEADTPDLEALAIAAEAARNLATSLEGITRQARDAAPPVPDAPDAPTSAPKRTRVPCPPGMRADTPEALDTMLRTRGLALIVDGYNVSMAGWSDARPAEQRTCLLAALERLHLRLRCDVLVVFDGADVVGVSQPKRAGVHVVFSAAGEEADPVVVREVGARPKRVPVIVASSDGWVRDHAEAEGATVVPAATLLDVLRR